MRPVGPLTSGREGDLVIANPIINGPYDEPARHLRFDAGGITDQVDDGRRPSSYFVPVPRPREGRAQLEIHELTADQMEVNQPVCRRSGSRRLLARRCGAGLRHAAAGPRVRVRRQRGDDRRRVPSGWLDGLRLGTGGAPARTAACADRRDERRPRHGEALLKKTGSGNLFTVFGERDVRIEEISDGIVVEILGVDVCSPTTGEVGASDTDGIAPWMVDTDDNAESFFVRHCYFSGDGKPDGLDPYIRLKKALKADIDESACATLYSTRSRRSPSLRPERSQ
jgi:adenine-specific DNA-methyltransferase